MSDSEFTRLRAEIAALEAQLASLKGVAGAAEALRPLLEERRRALAALERGEPLPPSVTQIGRLNVGPGASLRNTGDIVAGDKISAQGPLIFGDVTSGRDTNIAGRDQTIVNVEAAGPPPAPPEADAPLAPPPFRLVLTDPGGQPVSRLAMGDEAQLRLAWAGAPVELPALTLLAAGDGMSWLSGSRVELRPRPGQLPRLPQWPFVAEQAGSLTIEVLVLAGSTLLQLLTLEVPVAAAGDAGVLSGVQRATPAPEPRVAVVYDLAAAPAVAPGDDGLTLFFARGGETLRLVLIERGQSWEVALPLTDHDLAVLTQRAHEGLRDVVFQGAGRAFEGVTIPPGVADLALRRLARHGALLWEGLLNPPGAASDVHDLREHLRARSQRAPLRITVVGHRVALPWALLYDGDPGADVRADGFWGFRHQVAVQPLHGRRRALGGDRLLGPPRGLPALLALNLDLERQAGTAVIAEQRAAFGALDLAATEVTTETGLRDALAGGTDAALIYLYGHMQSPLRQVVGPTVDMDEIAIELSASGAALTLADLRRAAPVELQPRLRGGPLVVLNACGSGELTPLSFGGLVPYLLDLGARAVISTAVETPIRFGAAFGPALLTALLRDGLTAGEALRATRAHFLEQQRNPLGLLYGLSGNGDLGVGEG